MARHHCSRFQCDAELTGDLIHRQLKNGIRQARCQADHGCRCSIQQLKRQEMRCESSRQNSLFKAGVNQLIHLHELVHG